MEGQDQEFHAALGRVRFYLDQLEAERTMPSKRTHDFFETLCSLHSRFAKVEVEPPTIAETAERTRYFILGALCTVAVQWVLYLAFAKDQVKQFQIFLHSLL